MNKLNFRFIPSLGPDSSTLTPLTSASLTRVGGGRLPYVRGFWKHLPLLRGSRPFPGALCAPPPHPQRSAPQLGRHLGGNGSLTSAFCSRPLGKGVPSTSRVTTLADRLTVPGSAPRAAGPTRAGGVWHTRMATAKELTAGDSEARRGGDGDPRGRVGIVIQETEPGRAKPGPAFQPGPPAHAPRSPGRCPGHPPHAPQPP